MTTHTTSMPAKRTILATLALALLAALLAAPAVQAATPAPAWSITGAPYPTNVPLTDTFTSMYVYTVTNVGGAPTSGPVTITVTVPDGLTATGAAATNMAEFEFASCDVVGQTATCVSPGVVPPDNFITVRVGVVNSLTTPQVVSNSIAVSGGGAATASKTTPTTLSSALPAFDFLSGRDGLSSSMIDSDGSAVTQAGSHPHSLTVDLNFTTREGIGASEINPTEDPKALFADLPAGMVVNPEATLTRCTEAQLHNDVPFDLSNTRGCPDSSAVGTIVIGSGAINYSTPAAAPLYNMVPPPGVPAQFGFDAANIGVYEHIDGGVRSDGDYGLSATVDPILRKPSVLGATVTLWGDPSDPSHDNQRGRCGADPLMGFNCPVARTSTPFLTMPSACSDTLTNSVRAESWQNPGVFASTSSPTTDLAGNPVGVTGCEKLEFDPSISVVPDSRVASSPTGLDVSLEVPQNDVHNTLATANLKKAVVKLPSGMAVNPSAADGLGACSPAQIGLHSKGSPSCPDSSKIGTVKVTTPLLDEPLEGGVYLAKQNDNPFGSLLATYIVAEGQGVVIKLAGKVDPDPVTGQLQATFDDNPQLPFSKLDVHFVGGDRGVLTTPPNCGAASTHSSLTSWASSTPVELDSPSSIDQGCDEAGKFDPSFSAGSTSPSAGGMTSFVMDFSRPNGQQDLKGIDVTLPEGLLGSVGSVPRCPEAQATAGTCGAASRIGDVQASAGSGAHPVWIPQAGKAPTAVYLAGPYKGAPYSLSVVVPAQAGPFDLGTIVVRVALFIDRATTQVTAKSDPLPTILQGIPLDVREVRVSVDRPGFIVNPTSCADKQIAATISSTEGRNAPVSSRFQAADCASLAFKPKLTLALTGRKQVRTGKHPGVKAQVVQPKSGAAAIRKAVVTLPKSLALDPDNAQALCEFEDGTKPDLENHCPKGSIVGRVKAVSPLLDKPLAGNVYFVKNVRRSKTGNLIRTLPMIVVALRGDIAVNLKGESSTTRSGKLVNTFAMVPDAPVTKFNLNINGGQNGILTVTRTAKAKINICKTNQTANINLDAHNGKQADFNTRVKTPCAKANKKSKKAKTKK